MLNPFYAGCTLVRTYIVEIDHVGGRPKTRGVSNAGQDWGVEDLAIEQGR